jgi:DNA-directed RNA polymerase subunit RPC12/RpoP
MSDSVAFTCPTCSARLRAPARLIGKPRRCPGCRERVIVRPRIPDECGPVLVFEDDVPLPAPGSN